MWGKVTGAQRGVVGLESGPDWRIWRDGFRVVRVSQREKTLVLRKVEDEHCQQDALRIRLLALCSMFEHRRSSSLSLTGQRPKVALGQARVWLRHWNKNGASLRPANRAASRNALVLTNGSNQWLSGVMEPASVS